MDSDNSTDLGHPVCRQPDSRFRSPGLVRKSFGKEAIAEQSFKKSRRAKSSEPQPFEPEIHLPDVDENILNSSTVESKLVNNSGGKRWSMMVKSNENMSKSEMMNCYRLLMDEKLRLERFLSIISKHHEMARNRLESDLLDAMMCIEDLKQALEVRLARRRRVDPREAEERRCLIRQNKKLLNQLYESAKKIEHLEVTKVEMKEQLELLDFQILEVENQKALLEEELRKRPVFECRATQTDTWDGAAVAQLQSELARQRAETVAALGRQGQLDSLVRELRRDNVELRDQLAKLEDVEDSLAESDQPIAAATAQLQARVEELESKLSASQDQATDLDSRLSRLAELAHRLLMTSPTSDPAVKAAMSKAAYPTEDSVFQAQPHRHQNDRLLHEAIHTFHALVAERDRELAQLRAESQQGLNESQLELLQQRLMQCGLEDGTEQQGEGDTFSRTMNMVDRLVRMVQEEKTILLNGAKPTGTAPQTKAHEVGLAAGDFSAEMERLKSELAQLQSEAQLVDADSDKTRVNSPTRFYTAQLTALRACNQLELTQSQLTLTERRRADLETRLAETAAQLTQTQTELRTAETALSAARRTEAALRRRLLAAMDVQEQPQQQQNACCVQLQAALARAESTSASLLDSAQLDRTRLHEQSLRIAQFEAERRSLLDRICALQATEANAQRGIVRLQALYEDMLREYSESRNQELQWRSRERSRSNFKNTAIDQN